MSILKVSDESGSCDVLYFHRNNIAIPDGPVLLKGKTRQGKDNNISIILNSAEALKAPDRISLTSKDEPNTNIFEVLLPNNIVARARRH